MTRNNLDTKVNNILPDMWREACNKGNTLRFKVSSGSMMPMLNVGDVVKISSIEPSAVRIGDIIAFHDGRNVLVHRVIAKKWSDNHWSFRHRGDNAISSGIFEGPNLIGRVIGIDKEGSEISLDTLWHTLGNTTIGLGLRLTDSIDYRCPAFIRTVFHKIMAPLSRLFKKVLLWRL